MSLHKATIIAIFIVLRILLQLSGISEYLVHQQILSTPLTSQLRIREALSLIQRGQSPYDADILHETPLVISILAVMNYVSEKYGMSVFLLILDIITGLTMVRGIELQRELQKEQEKKRDTDSKNSNTTLNQIRIALQLQPDQSWDRNKFLALYFLNPLTLLVSATQSSVIFHNFIFALAFHSSLKRSPTVPIYLAIAAYLNLYSIFLTIPFLLIQRNRKNSSIPLFLILYTASLAGLLLTSHYACGDWSFVNNVYGCLLTISDHTPNLGFFWYFFMLTFQHFNLFFIAVFQLIIPSLLILLASRFHREPCFLLYLTVSVICIFKSYPSLGDAIIPLLLSFSWNHIFPCLRQVFVVLAMFIATCTLLPGFYFLWMYSGFGNANFFFAISLLYSLAHLFFLTDVIRAYLSREKFLDYCQLQSAAQIEPVFIEK